MRRQILLLLFTSWLIGACNADTATNDPNVCKTSPPFVQRIAGFNPGRSYFSTSEIRKMGLVLVENTDAPNAPQRRFYQHPSWRKAGWLSPIQLDEQGNIFTAPAPFINVLDNPIMDQNSIYRIDANTAEMNLFAKLPFPDTINQDNPYGIIGIDYLCDPGVLFVSTIAGSDRTAIRGGLFAVDSKTGKIIDAIHGYDAMGVGVNTSTGKRMLVFGTGRNSEVYAVELNREGKFSGEIRQLFSLASLGPRGDDKVRKIETSSNGHLLVHGIEFNYNLIAPREKQETIYEFSFNPDSKVWDFVGSR